MEEKKNIYWINSVRAICMIFVYFAHAETFTFCMVQPFNYFFWPFYVNAFLVVSGYLFFRKQLFSDKCITQTWKQYIGTNGEGRRLLGNIFCKLVIPTCIFAFVNYLPKKLIRGETIDIISCAMDTIGGCSLWFTCALVVAQVIYFIILLSRKLDIHIYIAISLLLAFLAIQIDKTNYIFWDNDNFPWFYKNGFMAMVYLSAGGLYYKYEERIDNLLSVPWIIILFFSYIVIEYIFPDNALSLISLRQMNLLGVYVSLVGSYLLIRLCKVLPKYSLIEWMGQYSLVFYFLSGGVPNVISDIFGRFVQDKYLLLIEVFVISILIGAIATYIINRYLPSLLDIRIVKPGFKNLLS